MSEWLPQALRYVEHWLAYQMRTTELPGCVIAIANGSELVFEHAFGVAELSTGEPMSPRHRFRVASHSKSFTASALMLLREDGRLRLDDPLGQYVPDLPKPLAAASIGQAMSHATGLVRDGSDCAHWDDLAPFPDRRRLREEMERPLVLSPGERMKYSNLGYGLLGLVIEAVTNEPFEVWISREVVTPAGLTETTPDFVAKTCEPFATSGIPPFSIGPGIAPIRCDSLPSVGMHEGGSWELQHRKSVMVGG